MTERPSLARRRTSPRAALYPMSLCGATHRALLRREVGALLPRDLHHDARRVVAPMPRVSRGLVAVCDRTRPRRSSESCGSRPAPRSAWMRVRKVHGLLIGQDVPDPIAGHDEELVLRI